MSKKVYVETTIGGQTVLVPQFEMADGTMVEPGENNPFPVKLMGSIVRLSTEPKPTEGITDGTMLMIVDVPGEYHIYYKGQWYKQ